MINEQYPRITGYILSGTGIFAALIFLSLGSYILFWLSISVISFLYITWWLLLKYSSYGFAKRVNELRASLIYSRTLEKRIEGDLSTDPIEKDDVDVFISQLLLGTMEEIPSWAITDIDQINDLKTIIQENPDRLDPDAQPTWLCFISTLFFIGCPILLVLALIMKIVQQD
jgi:hypothetical protein